MTSSESSNRIPLAPTRDGRFVFVCYSHNDSETVYQDIQQLNAENIAAWYDGGISPGRDWTDELANALDDCFLVLFFASKNSAESVHCRNECAYALGKKKPILTIYLDDVELPSGLRLSLSTTQAIYRFRDSASEYAESLIRTVKDIRDNGAGTRDYLGGLLTRRPKRNLALIVTIVAAILTTMAYFLTKPLPIGPGVAVLPFKTDSDISDQVLNQLTLDARAKVIPGKDVAAVIGDGNNISSENIARSLGIRYVLDGAEVTADNKPALTLYLTDTVSGFNTWSYTFALEGDNADKAPPSNLQDIAEAVAIYTNTPSEAALADAGTDSTDAYRAYQFARYQHLSWNPLVIDSALHYYDLAIEFDPTFYRAYGGLATALSDSQFILPSKEAINIAKSALLEIEGLGPEIKDRDRYEDLFVLNLVDWDLPELERILRTAIKSGDASPRLYGIYGFWVLRPSGLVREALSFIEYADANTVTRDEYERASILLWIAHTNASIGQFAKSDRALQGCYRLETRNLLCRTLGFLNAVQAGQLDRAATLWEDTKNLSISATVRNTGDMFLAAATGDFETAVRLLTLLESDPDAIPFYIGWMHMQFGNVDKGFKWWSFAYDVKDPNLLHNLYFGNLLVPDTIKQDSRYTKLIEKVGVTAEWRDHLAGLVPALPGKTNGD